MEKIKKRDLLCFKAAARQVFKHAGRRPEVKAYAPGVKGLVRKGEF